MRKRETVACVPLPARGAPETARGTQVGFAARRVGVLFDRLRLHLETDRFLAARRRDFLWEAGCDYAVLALHRLASRFRGDALDEPIRVAAAPAARRIRLNTLQRPANRGARASAGSRRSKGRARR